MYTCKDNLIPLLYSGKIKLKKKKKKKNSINTENRVVVTTGGERGRGGRNG